MNICEKRLLNAADFIEGLDHVQQLLNKMTNQDAHFMRGEAPNIKKKMMDAICSTGWVSDARVTSSSKISVNAIRDKIVVQIQLGNIARAFYDLLKIEAMYRNKRADGAILVVPMRQAANRLGQNIASYERVSTEIEDYKQAVTVPLLLLGVGN